ncbi:hypothetical protein [Nocardioides sp. URHA0032]|uniref:hypothetical protein n=1 Tax=Nocardioides sp. URHA0032 TaxID=1380388 RepID=UPI000B04C8E9|nr:hypothetical protein [Nocardioides sp. URHA0032]
MSTYHNCGECIAYMERRRKVLLPAMAAHCERTGEYAADALHRYMSGVHDRHVAGMSLAVTA